MTSAKGRFFVSLLCGFLSLGTLPARAAFPEQTVHLYVGFAPGGGADTLARLLAPKLAERWGKPVVVESKPGADGTIAADVVAHTAPDGTSLLFATSTHTITPAEHKLNYDPVNGFAPVSLLMKQPDVLVVNSSLPVNSAQEWVDYVKARPGQLNFGGAGLGGANFLEMEQFMHQTGLKMAPVMYQGGGATVVALLGGEIQSMFQTITTILEPVRSGKFRALAVTSDIRAPLLPQVPTVAEASGLTGFENGGVWYGVLAPAGTPKDIVAKIHDDLVAVVKTPDFQKVLADQGVQTVAGTPDQFSQVIKTDIPKWIDLVKTIDVK